jgi:tRNA threonylcarbamoyladenosine biosynthesis protein TsaE
MNFPYFAISNSEQDTRLIAEKFFQIIKAGGIVLLNGELGSGKTFFVKSVCKEFGFQNASSPSFAIVNEYSAEKKIVHFDFYRIKKIEELYDLGFEDYFTENEIVFIEWANLFPEILPKKNYLIDFKFVDNNSREITITKNE